jgi:hypothetical protein
VWVVAICGCGGATDQGADSGGAGQAAHDDGPTIFGFTPEVRAQMREVVVEADPNADADKVVSQYMDRLQKIAAELKVKPDSSGNYALPAEQADQLAKLREKGGVSEGMKILREFEQDLPAWAEHLLKQYESGTITPEREQLLSEAITVEIAQVSVSMSK